VDLEDIVQNTLSRMVETSNSTTEGVYKVRVGRSS